MRARELGDFYAFRVKITLWSIYVQRVVCSMGLTTRQFARFAWCKVVRSLACSVAGRRSAIAPLRMCRSRSSPLVSVSKRAFPIWSARARTGGACGVCTRRTIYVNNDSTSNVESQSFSILGQQDCVRFKSQNVAATTRRPPAPSVTAASPLPTPMARYPASTLANLLPPNDFNDDMIRILSTSRAAHGCHHANRGSVGSRRADSR